MRGIIRFSKIILTYLTGILSGIFIIKGIETFMVRKGTVGGEILILPLFIMLIVLGYWIGQEINDFREN